MYNTIIQSLRQVEQQYGVKILYACESGSRAWGLSSSTSDYDVRFIYVHPTDVYLSIDPVGSGKKRDVIECPITDLLDANGWDLTKALKLLRKSNPPLLEWLHSPIVYEENFSIARQMKEISQTTFSPASCLHHYANMAARNVRSLPQTPPVKVKPYLSVLRPLLAAKWIEDHLEFPPLAFQSLIDGLNIEESVQKEISRIVQRKMTDGKLEKPPGPFFIDGFLQRETERITVFAKSMPAPANDPSSILDQLFREALNEVWGNKPK